MVAKTYNQNLKREFEKRKKKNPRYSQRAFARDLELEPSTLSKFLRNERNVTLKIWQKMTLKLDLGVDEDDGYYPDHQIISKKDLSRYRWYHMAVLECFHLTDIEFNSKEISQKTGVKQSLTDLALRELVEMSFLQEKDGRFQLERGKNRSKDFGSIPAKRIVSDFLDIGKEALFQAESKRRQFGAIVVATNQKKVTEARQRMISFDQSLVKFLEDCEEKNDIFVYCVGLFPVSKK